MQAKKNKILSIILLSLIAVTVFLFLYGEKFDQLDIDRDQFAFTDPISIDKVVLYQPEGDVQLIFQGNEWEVNDKYKADPQRIKVLFAILKQVSIRRKVSKQEEDSLRQLMNGNAVRATFYSNGGKQHEVKVLGNEQRGVTYMTQGNNDIYLVEIPGYRSYLAGIFELDANAWRDPLVFDVNWRNLQQVSMLISAAPESSYTIDYNDGQYRIKELDKTDTTKLFNILDDISLLYVNDFLSSDEIAEIDSSKFTPTATIIVEDVGQNKHTLEVLQELTLRNVFLIRKDSSKYAILETEKLRRVLRPKRYFEIN